MLAKLRHRPSVGTVLGALALFVALDGPAEAGKLITGGDIRNSSVTGADIKNESLASADIKNDSLTGADIKNRSVLGVDVAENALTGEHINERSLGKVPSADRADAAGNADRAGFADNAGSLNGVALSDLARTSQFALPSIATINPLANGWKPHATFRAPGFYKDPFGVVHLVGALSAGNVTGRIFDLPNGFKPSVTVGFAVSCTADSGYLEIRPSGEVSIFNLHSSDCIKFTSLDGVSFRTD